MLIDLHAHSSGISPCCCIAVPEVLREAKRVGLDGIVLTNHYQKSSVKNGDAVDFARRYLEEYHTAVRLGERIGCKTLFGIEVTAERYHLVHLLIYGVDEDFVLEHPTMFDYTLEELYRLVKARGGCLVQAHPFRRVDSLMDVKWMDGIEISCHPKYESTHLEKIAKIATRWGKILTCGGDYHADTPYRPRCGMYLPDEVRDTYDLARFLLSAPSVELCVHEIGQEAPHRVTFARGEGITQ
ncbi:MAG: hypothetical protein IJX39_02175 [Clostridia bacterium]|nr:hypothetical protein [Clostridia bacterium]